MNKLNYLQLGIVAGIIIASIFYSLYIDNYLVSPSNENSSMKALEDIVPNSNCNSTNDFDCIDTYLKEEKNVSTRGKKIT